MSKETQLTITSGIVLIVAILAIVGIVSIPKSPETKSTANELLKINEQDWTKGQKTAPVVLVEYMDLECEACAAYEPVLKQLSHDFENDLLLIVRYYPLPIHFNGVAAAQAVEAAGKQGKFWEMHDLLFEKQKEWKGKSTDINIFDKYATQLSLDMTRFKEDIKSAEVKNRINRDRDSGSKLGVDGTPTFFLNGESIDNPRSAEDFSTLIKAAVIKAPKPTQESLGEKVHEHADFKVYINNKAYDFSQTKYQSTDEEPLDIATHLHDGNGNIIHKHYKGKTLGYFFKTLGITFTTNCFGFNIQDKGPNYCNEANKKLKLYVNGKPNTEFEKYEFDDLDKILISYGNDSENVIQNQIKSVTDEACMYSEKCPERGAPPTEGCVGGLGTEC